MTQQVDCLAYMDCTSAETNEWGQRLLKFADFSDLTLANTYEQHKKSRMWTWHSPNGEHHNQIDYIMVKKCFQLSVNVAWTWSFPGADIGSDHDLVMTVIRMHLKRLTKCKQAHVCFNLEKLKNPRVAEEFQATLRDKLTPLIMEMNTNMFWHWYSNLHLQCCTNWSIRWSTWTMLS